MLSYAQKKRCTYVNSTVRTQIALSHVNSTVRTQDQQKSNKKAAIPINKIPTLQNDNISHRNRYVCSI